MTIEITDCYISNRIITIEGIDCSEEHMDYINRVRDDGIEKNVIFQFDTTDTKALTSVRYYLKRQRAVQKLLASGKPSWGDTIRVLIGQIVESPSNKYRVWSY